MIQKWKFMKIQRSVEKAKNPGKYWISMDLESRKFQKPLIVLQVLTPEYPSTRSTLYRSNFASRIEYECDVSAAEYSSTRIRIFYLDYSSRLEFISKRPIFSKFISTLILDNLENLWRETLKEKN